MRAAFSAGGEEGAATAATPPPPELPPSSGAPGCALRFLVSHIVSLQVQGSIVAAGSARPIASRNAIASRAISVALPASPTSRAPTSVFVDEDDLAALAQRVDQQRIPVVEVAPGSISAAEATATAAMAERQNVRGLTPSPSAERLDLRSE